MANNKDAQNKSVIADFAISRSTSKVLTIAIPCIVLILVVVAASVYIRHKNDQHINLAKLAAVESTDDCVKGLKTVSAEQPNPKQVSSSIKLLSYRASCYEQIGNYQETISTLQQIADYYNGENDSKDATIVSNRILGIQEYLARPVNETPLPGEPIAVVKSFNQEQKQQ